MIILSRLVSFDHTCPVTLHFHCCSSMWCRSENQYLHGIKPKGYLQYMQDRAPHSAPACVSRHNTPANLRWLAFQHIFLPCTLTHGCVHYVIPLLLVCFLLISTFCICSKHLLQPACWLCHQPLFCSGCLRVRLSSSCLLFLSATLANWGGPSIRAQKWKKCKLS